MLNFYKDTICSSSLQNRLTVSSNDVKSMLKILTNVKLMKVPHLHESCFTFKNAFNKGKGQT